MNTLKNIGFTIALLFVASCVFGQETQENPKRIISLSMYKSIMYYGGNTSSASVISLGNFTPAVAWGMENDDFHEIEVTKLNFSSRNSSFNLGLGVNYTYNWKVIEAKSSTYNFYVGTGINPSFSTSHNTSTVSTNFPYSNTSVGVNLSIVPLFRWNVSDKFFLNFSAPYRYYNYSYNYSNNENPATPLEQRKQIINSSKIFPNDFTVRVGIGIKF